MYRNRNKLRTAYSVCAGSGCWVQCPQKKHGQCDSIRVDSTASVFTRTSLVGRAVSSCISFTRCLPLRTVCTRAVTRSFWIHQGSCRPCASHSGQLVHRIWGIPRNLAHRIRVTLTPSLETRITTSRLLCCVLCCRICADVSRWWHVSNVCRKSGTLTRRNILKEDKSEDVSLHVAFTRLILLACTCRGPWNRSFRADKCDAQLTQGR